MKIKPNSEDIRRLSFVDALYKNLRQQTQAAIEDRKHLIKQAGEYLIDGASDTECVELLIIDGLARESAESYVQAAKDHAGEVDDSFEYSFRFEDVDGRIWSSCDANQTVCASDEQEAWTKAETDVFSISNVELERIVSVNRVL